MVSLSIKIMGAVRLRKGLKLTSVPSVQQLLPVKLPSAFSFERAHSNSVHAEQDATLRVKLKS